MDDKVLLINSDSLDTDFSFIESERKNYDFTIHRSEKLAIMNVTRTTNVLPRFLLSDQSNCVTVQNIAITIGNIL